LSIFDAAKTDPIARRRLAIAIVFLQTLFGAAAQILMKNGTQSHQGDSLIHLLVGIFTNPKLFMGYCLYGCAAALMVVALKYGELSILYPVIAMTYVWVTGLSVLFLNESLNPWKLGGLSSIVLGVAVLGRSRPAGASTGVSGPA
jgi:drug/metabolite transporter (DMT)-like permease